MKIPIKNIIPIMLLAAFFLSACAVAIAQEDRSLKRNRQEGENRLALVIGNGAYAGSPLKNPVNDAGDMAKALEKAGFTVKLLTDSGQRQMEEAIQQLGDQLHSGGIGLFYFAGHGVQVNNTNYLIPVDARIRTEADVRYEAVDANRIMSQMEAAGNRMNLVFLDACRNNPYARSFRSARQGLAQMENPSGSMVAFATAPGSVAADGAGRNGVFTKYLIQAIQTPDLEIGRLMRSVRSNVQKETGGAQTPFELTSLVGEFYFTGSGGAAAANVTRPPATAQPGYNVNAEEELWLAVKKSGGVRDYEYFLEQYPNSPFARTARYEVSKIREAASRSTLTITTKPADADIKILNIREQYNPGMSLFPGTYRAEISAEGYETRTESFEIPSSEEFVLSVTLKSLGPKVGDTYTYTDPATGMEFVGVPGGCFQMGDTFGDGDAREKPVHEVCVDGFFIGKYEVTQGEYQRITGSNPAGFKKGDRYPVEQVSWNDAQSFISSLQSKSGKTYRLPTEAEWEYAARSGGKSEKYSGSNSPDGVAWSSENSGRSTHPVGTRSPNGLGIHDMSGNVWEWCSDWYGENYYSSSPRLNPQGPSSGSIRVNRGGSWGSYPRNVRAADRYGYAPAYASDFLGFRLVLPEGR